ncbi:uncharacterized protein LOC141601586 [Silene latifolia]|uniref:uncharacterized protein LOC141601586 n=1 Tax=Silene latifolia TaxID=37657 RepID=UPI003D7813CE
MHNHGVGLFGLIETKIKPTNLLNKNTSLCDGWSITTNCSWHKGGRIWVFWKPDLFDLQFLSYDAQYIHMHVHSRVDNKSFLKLQSQSCVSPWLWLGDFNAVLSPIERLGGSTTEAEMEHFRSVSHFVEPAARVYSRLDRAMGNEEWLDEFGDFMDHFHSEGLFDHCPCTVVNKKAEFDGRRSFKYFNMWGAAESFKEQVASVWQHKHKGTRMFSVVKKLKSLKPVLKKLNTTCFSDIENSTTIASRVLEEIQEKLVDNPGDTDLIQ